MGKSPPARGPARAEFNGPQPGPARANYLARPWTTIGTSEKLLTSIIKQSWRQESIGVHMQNIQNFLIAHREPI